MSSPNNSLPSGRDASTIENQTFIEWSKKRFEMYQQVEQQAQESIAHTLELARNFAAKMEEEVGQLLSHYHRERSEVQIQLDEVRREVDELQEEKSRLEQECQQAKATIEEYRNAAKTKREQILREAYAERDRILTEVQQIVQQQVGQAMTAWTSKTIATARDISATPDSSAGDTAEYEEPEEVEEAEEEVPIELEEAEEEAPTYDQDEESSEGWHDIRLMIEGVESFILASELIDRFEEHEATKGVNLSQYEQKTLQLSVQRFVGDSFEDLIINDFADVLTFYSQDENTVRLRYRG